MSFANVAKRSVRIIALPLATPAPRMTPTHAHSEHLTYYHFATPPPSAQQQDSWENWVTLKASSLWADLGKAPEGNWKRRVFLYGERLVDRLDFEELALKSFDTSLGPKLIPNRYTEKVRPKDHPTIPLIYPPSACASPLPHLRSLLAKRTPRHRKGCIMWIAIAPLTAPFMLIPIVPNFPFFFCAWRAWSHYQAFKASQYLEAFVAQGAILPQESSELDDIYTQHAPVPPDPEASATSHSDSSEEPPSSPSPSTAGSAHVTPDTPSGPSSTPIESVDSKSSSNTAGPACAPNNGHNVPPRPHLLLTRAAVPALERLLELTPNSSFAADVYRALEQARLRLDKEGR
ncbi:uncharacterized protein FIBRA_04585 [Fibroporia radiculosa]|uniref:Mitochondrial K+-H+ exchange-related-domain-containing protein n=1 Tax=Fibroporia radiculosa TaxID=599839 RepID=J4GPH7_9APHY|nr:uncharacterized protein FIBRA_04585 [Fibroporia radiculosa]CCM02485.1 predicted protein [Fibroporia radiculosa]